MKFILLFTLTLSQLISIYPQHYVGELFGGGVVFYTYQNGNHGLICSNLDIAIDNTWGGNGTEVIKGNGASSLWDGKSNTEAIIKELDKRPSAAKLCTDFAGGGFVDWYLPSLWELFTLYQSAWIITKILEEDSDESTIGISNTDYWHSTELNSTDIANFKWFNNAGREVSFGKMNPLRVRAIRQF